MYQFIETIYYKDGEMPLLYWHEQRFTKTQMAHFGRKIHLELAPLIALKRPNELLDNQVYKVRVVYSENDISFEFLPYQKKKITELHLVQNDTMDYSFKYADRTSLDYMKRTFDTDAEIIIVQNGLLTDTTFTNIALYDGISWVTPKIPLLEGVQRSFLLDDATIKRADIHVDTLYQYSQVKLFNAMVDWDEAWTFPVNTIQISF